MSSPAPPCIASASAPPRSTSLPSPPIERVVAAVAVQHVVAGQADQRVVELPPEIVCDPVGADRASPAAVRCPAEHHVARAGTVAVRVGASGADDQVVEAVAVDVARRGDGTAAEVARRLAAELEAVAAVEARQVDVRRRSLRPCRTPRSSRRRRLPCGSAPRAPTIRSSKPSPLTSPAEATGAAAAVVRRRCR